MRIHTHRDSLPPFHAHSNGQNVDSGHWLAKVKQRLKENSFSVCPHLPFSASRFIIKVFLAAGSAKKGIGTQQPAPGRNKQQRDSKKADRSETHKKKVKGGRTRDDGETTAKGPGTHRQLRTRTQAVAKLKRSLSHTHTHSHARTHTHTHTETLTDTQGGSRSPREQEADQRNLLWTLSCSLSLMHAHTRMHALTQARTNVYVTTFVSTATF